VPWARTGLCGPDAGVGRRSPQARVCEVAGAGMPSRVMRGLLTLPRRGTPFFFSDPDCTSLGRYPGERLCVKRDSLCRKSTLGPRAECCKWGAEASRLRPFKVIDPPTDFRECGICPDRPFGEPTSLFRWWRKGLTDSFPRLNILSLIFGRRFTKPLCCNQCDSRPTSIRSAKMWTVAAADSIFLVWRSRA